MSIFDSKWFGDWLTALSTESAFWQRWIETGGAEWPDDYKRRIDRYSNADQFFVEAFRLDDQQQKRKSRYSLLDVGSGPLSIHGNDSQIFSVTPIDPLASLYRCLMERKKIDLPSQPIFGLAESLTSNFRENSFDFVTCINALDQSISPLDAILQMLAVLKPGGKVFLSHDVNAGAREHYVGLHKWNFSINKVGGFAIWRPGRQINGLDHYQEFAKEDLIIDLGKIEVVLTKTKDFDCTEIRRSAQAFSEKFLASAITHIGFSGISQR